MLITEIKPAEELTKSLDKKIAVIRCIGCKEAYFPWEKIEDFVSYLPKLGIEVILDFSADYLCNPEYAKVYYEENKSCMDACDRVLIFSCGVGVQVFSSIVEKIVVAGCNTLYIDGFQGFMPAEYSCAQCGNCILTLTAGICPITQCSKSLLHGPCGGAKNSKCEVDSVLKQGIECGWEKIYQRAKKLNLLHKVGEIKIDRLHDYHRIILESEKKVILNT
jgi:hypothetical protein